MAVAARDLPFTYAEVGGTRAGPPQGYRLDRRAVDLGAVGVFDRAVAGLLRWEAQRGSGARIFPADALAVAEQTIVVALSLPLVTMVAPCRVVYVTDEPDRRGFAYGTLEGHPVQGEESFHVVRAGNRVRFEVMAFSRPHHPLARLGSPVAHAVQAVMARRYLRALTTAVDGSP